MRQRLAIVLALCALAACRTSEAAEPAQARRLTTIQGFGFPESAKYDADQDVFFVTNMAGPGSRKDGNGYIVRVDAANPDNAAVWIQGGRGGAVLDAPKGMALHGDTLWVRTSTWCAASTAARARRWPQSTCVPSAPCC